MAALTRTCCSTRWSAVCIGPALVVLALLASPSALAADHADCQTRTAVDYLAPFDPLVPPHPPSRRPLSFGPPGFELDQLAPEQVVGSGGVFGYAANLKQPMSGAGRSLNWTVVARLQRLRVNGTLQETSKRRSWQIPDSQTLDGHIFALDVPRPGLYRFSIQFSNKAGPLSTFTQYVRGARRRLATSLLVDRTEYLPGDEVSIQVSNRGTEGVGYGEGGQLSMFQDGTWVPLFSLPTGGKRKGIVLGAGERGRCERFFLPVDLISGTYRVEKRIIPFVDRAEPRVLVRVFTIGI